MVTSRIPLELLNHVISATKDYAAKVELLYVTNLIEGDIKEYGDRGLSMSSQYYYESETSALIGAFQNIGFSVRPFYNELDFIKWASGDRGRNGQQRWQLVVTTAEGGHGEGRRALIPSFCSLVGLPCWNSPAHGSSVARHKYHANKLLASCGVRVPEVWSFSPDRGWLNNHCPELGTKVILKPAWESGSKGVDDESIMIVEDAFQNAVAGRARSFGQPCVVQEFKTGYEVGAPIIGIPKTKAAGLIGFSDGGCERYGARARTFDDEKISKSAGNFAFNHVPEAQIERALATAERAFDLLGMKTLGRIDMRIDEDGAAWIFDTNESPPPLPRSSFVRLFESFGFAYLDVLALMIGVNLLEHGQIQLPS